jgi:hypothetical protein
MTILVSRTQCVICSGPLDSLYTIPSTPITCSPSQKSFENDVYVDVDVQTCEHCGCVQIKDLIDPEILYASVHNGTEESRVWKEHHREFARFLLSEPVSSCMEVGGGTGALFNHLPDQVNYTCLDMYPPLNPRMSYEQGNCETYAFSAVKCLVMSHVFEHLYTPMTFLKTIADAGVDDVVISIPNMTSMLATGYCAIVFNEHTYYVDSVNAEWMFSQHGYRRTHIQEYGSHSTFMRFRRDVHTRPLSLENRPFIASRMKEIFYTMRQRFTRQVIHPNSFLAPGGHLGQLLYTITKPPRILGFLDNDRNKHGLRVYGTPYTVSPFEILCDHPGTNVYLYGGAYTDEIVAQIRRIQPDANVILI